MTTLEQRTASRRKQRFLRDVVHGLSDQPKRLPCKYLYDERGSKLFDQICTTDEYYVTRTELQIMRDFSHQMGHEIGPRTMLVEYGSGSSQKTRVLLDHLIEPVAYSPVDISRTHLMQIVARMENDYSGLEILPIPADFTDAFELPKPSRTPDSVTVYFPGSTIGNFEEAAAVELLSRIRQQCGAHGGLLIGIDLQKDIATIEAAYNDAQGITDAFSLNLLTRINRELGANFQETAFRHVARYDSRHHRMDIRLVSNRAQTVRLGNHEFRFTAGESIHTEYSHKYSVTGFADLAARAGFQLKRHWTDAKRLFGVLYLTTED